MRSRLGASAIGFALVVAVVAGCSSTTAGSTSAVQDAATAGSSGAPAASAAAAPSCADGGACQIGDVGPGGGIVFYVASKPFTETGAACASNCSYLEAQPTDLSPAAWCTGPGAAPKYLVDAPGTAIGTGYTNTNSMIGTYMNPPANICTGGAGSEAAATWGGTSDWFLPAVAELFALLSAPTSVTGISAENSYWSSTFGKAAQNSTACALMVVTVNANESCPSPVQPSMINGVFSVRPVRAF